MLNYGLDYRIVDVEADGGETLITVQFYTDHNQFLPMHKVSYRIGENLVFVPRLKMMSVIPEIGLKSHSIDSV